VGSFVLLGVFEVLKPEGSRAPRVGSWKTCRSNAEGDLTSVELPIHGELRVLQYIKPNNSPAFRREVEH
jgi:hypothetical protein